MKENYVSVTICVDDSTLLQCTHFACIILKGSAFQNYASKMSALHWLL